MRACLVGVVTVRLSSAPTMSVEVPLVLGGNHDDLRSVLHPFGNGIFDWNTTKWGNMDAGAPRVSRLNPR